MLPIIGYRFTYLRNFQKHPHQPSFYASCASTYPPYRREPTATAMPPMPPNRGRKKNGTYEKLAYLKKADEEASAHKTER
jgi:hypothetical protein